MESPRRRTIVFEEREGAILVVEEPHALLGGERFTVDGRALVRGEHLAAVVRLTADDQTVRLAGRTGQRIDPKRTPQDAGRFARNDDIAILNEQLSARQHTLDRFGRVIGR